MTALSHDSLIGVVGAGAMGAGIAQVAAQAGHPVLLCDAKPGAAEAGRARIVAGLDALVAKGRLQSARRDDIASRIAVTQTLAGFGAAALVIEAIAEDLAAKRALFHELEAVVEPAAILATNTSSLSVTALAAGLQRPERLAGLHFFNPPPVMKLVEIVAGLASDRAVLDQLANTATRWGKMIVHARSTPGFIVNRVARPFYGEALRLLEEGAADAATLDAILREAGGFRMGPFELMDLIGHDVNLAVTRSVFEASFGDPRYRPSLVQTELVAAGWLGRKSSHGFYDYAPGATQPQASSAPASPPPTSVAVEGRIDEAHALEAQLRAAGIEWRVSAGAGFIRLPEVSIGFSDGRTATERVAAGAPKDLVLCDLAFDFAAARRVALTKADQSSDAALRAASGFFQTLGKSVSVVDDTPGLVVLRILAMLANEAAEAVHTAVASPADIDRAMLHGVNYPKGPLNWADTVGPARILRTLDALQAAYGDDRYRPSQWLRRKVAAGVLLGEPAA